MSRMADEVHSALKRLFPYEVIVPEHYVRYKGAQLFFDFFMKDLGILFEIQGQQHYEFTKHFHDTAEKFKAQKYRDNLKKEYVQISKELCLVYFNDEEDKITDDLVLSRIYEAQNKEEGV